jgi:hypothetical protein
MGAPVAAVLLYAVSRHSEHRRAQNTLAQLQSQEPEAVKLLSQHCACPWMAVEYLEWNGSVHTFRFHNFSYAEAFSAANATKVPG